MIKKTLFKFLLVLTVIFSIGVTNIFADSTGVVTASKLNVRKGPSTKYSRMGSLYKNKSVTISRLSYGIPMGAEIDYLDVLTLDKALSDRKIIS